MIDAPSDPKISSSPDSSNASGNDSKLSEAQLRQFGLRQPEAPGKHYVLDTNVLLHDPGCLNRFQENHLCIPADVLSELDRFKNEQTERGANARKIHRTLLSIFDSSESVTSGVSTDGGGTIRLVIYDPDLCDKSSAMLQQFHRIFPDPVSPLRTTNPLSKSILR